MEEGRGKRAFKYTRNSRGKEADYICLQSEPRDCLVRTIDGLPELERQLLVFILTKN